jgi:outer membrane protein assembly factor BamB
MRRLIPVILLFLFLAANASEKWNIIASGNFGTKPIVDSNTVFAGSYDGNMYALQPNDGKLIWFANMTGPIEVDPVLASQYLIVADSAGAVSALDKARGSRVWSYNTTRAFGLRGTQGTVYVTTLGRIVALDANTGNLLWEQKAGAGNETPQSASPAAINSNGTVVYAVIDNRLTAFAANDGTRLWNLTIGRTWKSAPIVLGDTIYVGCTDNTMYAVDANKGIIRWTYTTNAWIASAPLVYDSILYFGSNDNYLYALRASNGELLWKFKTGEAVQSEPVMDGDIVYFGSNDGRLYALDRKNGSLVWTYDVGSWVHSPAVKYGFVYFGANDKRLHAAATETNCDILAPERDAVVGSTEMLMQGTAYAAKGVSMVEVQVNSRGWQEANGTENWTLFFNPADVPDGRMKIECRITDRNGNREVSPYFAREIEKNSMVLEEMEVKGPASADVGRKFNITVTDKRYKQPLSKVTVAIGGKSYKGDDNGVVEIYLESGGQQKVTVSRQGYSTVEFTITGRDSGATVQLIGFLAVGLLGVLAYFFIFRKRGSRQEEPKTEFDQYGIPVEKKAKK